METVPAAVTLMSIGKERGKRLPNGIRKPQRKGMGARRC